MRELAVTDPSMIRNVGVVGHRGSGKTSLVEALVYTAGAKNRLGSVADGTTTTGYDEDEIARQMTISSGFAYVEWEKQKINLVDTPGEASFINDAMATIDIVESVLMVVNAVNGVEVQTERLWKRAEERGVARLVVVNMLDRERASFSDTLALLRERFGPGAVPIALPMGTEGEFSGFVDLVTGRAYSYEEGEPRAIVGEVPEDLGEAVEEAREMLLDTVAETDDQLIEKYLEGVEISESELSAALRAAVAQGHVFPVLPYSATKNLGSDRLLDTIVGLLSSPMEAVAKEIALADGSGSVDVSADTSEPPVMFTFKTVSDQFSGRVSMVRVMSGKITTGSQLVNARTKEKERTGNILLLNGKDSQNVEEAIAGDLVALAKLKDTQTGDTLADEERLVVIPPYEFPPPAISFAVTPQEKGGEEKISKALRRLSEEDPAMQMRLDRQTKELVVSGTSQVHVEVILDRMKRRFGVEVDLYPPQVPYRETIRKRASAQGRHKKQSGGRGQFGDCFIEIQPLPRGEGFVFEDAIVGGSIPKTFIPAVEKGIVETMQKGVLAGYPVVDVKVRLYDGSYHSVDSSEMAFKIAGSLAFSSAVKEAAPVILEPVMSIEVVAPEENMGDVMGDLSGRRGRPQGSETMGEMQIIRAEVPLSETLSYAPQLRSMTGGRGSFTVELDHYAEVPGQLQQKIIEEARIEGQD